MAEIQSKTRPRIEILMQVTLTLLVIACTGYILVTIWAEPKTDHAAQLKKVLDLNDSMANSFKSLKKTHDETVKLLQECGEQREQLMRMIKQQQVGGGFGH